MTIVDWKTNCPMSIWVNLVFESTLNTLSTFQQSSNLPIFQCFIGARVTSEARIERSED